MDEGSLCVRRAAGVSSASDPIGIAGPPGRPGPGTRRAKRGAFRLGLIVSTFLACAGLARVEVVWPADLGAARKEMLTRGLELLKKHPAIPYREGGADTEGMDCSGAIVWLLKQAGLDPPRSAHAQYHWLQKEGRLTLVPASVRRAEDPVFARLRPGDLLFWARDGGEQFRVTHVHMFLGKEADGHPVMIGSSDGRGYRGQRRSGFGIVDFHVPREGSATRLVGFGSPFPSERR